eukprot:CAMPEP_0168533006 /NCGR_PEP_ID=MMETSP0405-20121227/16740_1 /TAXON_ID=498012 /ORGANISM="Trichosphaerium sp, Strain Am-I-7 wt" /LENGTH=111 /DNA_ID=CAMNT_0008558825 /DNA_START=113 /DNA_END=448 /DNA_ORIENTATION=+
MKEGDWEVILTRNKPKQKKYDKLNSKLSKEEVKEFMDKFSVEEYFSKLCTEAGIEEFYKKNLAVFMRAVNEDIKLNEEMKSFLEPKGANWKAIQGPLKKSAKDWFNDQKDI